MKKFLSILAVSTFVLFAADNVVAANQQGGGKTPHVKGFVSNGFWDNWEIQGGVGLSFNLGTGSGASNSVLASGYLASANGSIRYSE